MKKSAISFLTVFVVFLFTASAFADIISGSMGAAWQSAVNPDNDGTPFWDHSSWDSPSDAQNVGFYLNGTTGGLSDPPGNLPFWGIGNSADSSFFFQNTSAGNDVTLKVEVAGLSGINEFGYYLIANSGILVPIFTGSDSPITTDYFAPEGDYGFYLKTNGNTWTTEVNGDHFAVFRESATPGAEIYWIGMEDLPLMNSDRDYNDMIVKISAVPVPEPGILILLGLSMISIATLRRWWK